MGDNYFINNPTDKGRQIKVDTLSDTDSVVVNKMGSTAPIVNVEDHIGLTFSDDEQQSQSNKDEHMERAEYKHFPNNTNAHNHFTTNSDCRSSVSENTSRDILKKKAFSLGRIRKYYADKGLQSPYDMTSSYRDVQYEDERIKIESNSENGSKFLKNGLLACFHGMELLNNRVLNNSYLDGYGDHMSRVVNADNTCEEILVEIYQKWYSTLPESPEMKLGLFLATNTFLFIVSKQMINSKTSKLGDLLKTKANEMKGPSKTAEEMMKDLDEMSDISSICSSSSLGSIVFDKPDTKTIEMDKTKPPKKRGRRPTKKI